MCVNSFQYYVNMNSSTLNNDNIRQYQQKFYTKKATREILNGKKHPKHSYFNAK